MLSRSSEGGANPAAARQPRTLEAPANFPLSPEQAAVILGHVGYEARNEEAIAEGAALCNQVVACPHPYEDVFDVGKYRLRSWDALGDLSTPPELRCNCEGPVTRGCAHGVAVVLACAWRSPRTRWLFEVPAWEAALRRLRRPPRKDSPEAELPVVDSRNKDESIPDGWIRYHIEPPPELDWTWSVASANLFRRELVRQSKVDGRALKPRKLRDRVPIEHQIRRPTPLDHAFSTSLRRIEALEKGGSSARQQRRDVIEEMVADLLLMLADAREVYYDGVPVRISRKKVVPSLRVTDDEDGALKLSWHPTPARLLRLGNGFLVDRGGTVHPLDASVPEWLVGELLEPLPLVPKEDTDRFVAEYAVSSIVPVRLDTSTLPNARDPSRIEARLILSEEDEAGGGTALVVTPTFGYVVGAEPGQESHDGVVEVSPEEPSTVLALPDEDHGGAPMVVRRDLELEARYMRGLGDVVPGVMPVRLSGDAALDFLVDVLPGLAEEWTVYGEAGLANYRVGGSASAKVSVPSGTDWFDLDIKFEVGDGRTAAPKPMLRSWIEGRRYHRLDDGSFVRLPEQWLARHGNTLHQLDEIRQASGGELALYALPLASALLDEIQAPPGSNEAERLREWQTLLGRMERFESVPELDVPKGVTADLRDYQVDGWRWLAYLREIGLGGCLADDMGLGKTLQALTLLADSHEVHKKRRRKDALPSLVVAPTSVVYNWVAEAERFCPGMRVVLHHGPERDKTGVEMDGADLVVTSFALLRIDREFFTERRWRHAILDEAQQIKNPDSQVARSARALRAEQRLVLTGTPLENNLFELWSIFQYLMPGFFGSRAAFSRRYAGPIHKKRSAKKLAELRQRLRPFVLRRLKSEVASELPPRQEVVLRCELGPAQRELYERVKATYRESVIGRVSELGVGRAQLHILEALTRLRQACCDPALLPFPEARQVNESAKTELLLETLEETSAEGHRTLVYSQWPSLLKRVRTRLEGRGIDTLYLDGQTTKRHELAQRWNEDDDLPVFLISLKAGGTGLNLTGADHVIHLDPWWNPAVEAQATDRAHRIGQTRPVVAYKLVAAETVEEKILELQERKRALFEATVDTDRVVVDTLTREDLEVVFAPSAAYPLD